ncbi:MAG: helix-turn-helix domain-containing protein [Candidatus Kapabacteria bacterium]|nr:helix-turn-helix domain-containing protein [Candidatus Kapabacteria bacterium]
MRAAQLHRKGWRVIDIASALSVSSAAVSQWLAALKKDGEDGLKSRPKTGAPGRLSVRHNLMLKLLLKQQPRANNIDAPEWDRALVQAVVKRLFGVKYSVQHCGRLLKKAQVSSAVVPRVMRLELDDLIKKADIARIRKRLDARNARRIR